jgi:hypothetical protein
MCVCCLCNADNISGGGDVRIRVSEVCAQRGDAMLNAIFFD